MHFYHLKNDRLKIVNSLKTILQGLSFWLGPVLFCLFFFVNPFGLDEKASKVIAVAALMITWWVTEALPMPVVALMPAGTFSIIGHSQYQKTAAPYAMK